MSTSSLNRKMSSEEALPQDFKLTIKSQDNREHSFMINGEKKLRRLFSVYCKKTNVDYATVDFLYDGNRLSSNKTPLEMGLEHGDVIDAMLRQSGGGLII